MTRAETITFAIDAGFIPMTSEEMDMFVAFAKLVAEHEREACAELRKTLSATPHKHIPQLQPAVESALDFYAKRILARGQA
jgi:hypothetical protein